MIPPMCYKSHKKGYGPSGWLSCYINIPDVISQLMVKKIYLKLYEYFLIFSFIYSIFNDLVLMFSLILSIKSASLMTPRSICPLDLTLTDSDSISLSPTTSM